MSKFLPITAATLCLGLLVLGVFVFDPACLPHHPLLEKNPLLPTWANIIGRKEQLKQLEEDLIRHADAKQQVAKEVIAGRRSLREAIEDYQSLDQEWFSAGEQELKLRQLKLSEEEWRGRSVIAFARRVLADRPDEAATVTDRLEKELQKLLADRKEQYPRFADPWIKPAR